LITATFSLIQQIVNMKGLPTIRMLYTSDTIQGQVYIPAINWALMVAVIVVVAAFKSSTALTNAYGFAVATVMFSTSVLIAIQIRYVKHLPAILSVSYFLIFGFFDGLFWGAALKKVPQGAWVPLVIGIVLTSLMLFWTWAKGLEDTFDGANRKNLRHFIHVNDMSEKIMPDVRPSDVRFENDLVVDEDREQNEPVPTYYFLTPEAELAYNADRKTSLEGKRELARIPTCAIFHKIASGKGVPHTFVGFIRQWPALPRIVIFLSIRVLPVARVSSEERYAVDKVRSVSGFYGVTYFIGFRDKFDIKVDDLIARICSLEVGANPRESSETINEIQRAAEITTHIVPHYHVVSKQLAVGKGSTVVNWARTFLIEEIYRRLVTMFPETANWLTSADEIIHVGINATI
jgi:KUP system potassium uptake protein